jgi:hypothetical protein
MHRTDASYAEHCVKNTYYSIWRSKWNFFFLRENKWNIPSCDVCRADCTVPVTFYRAEKGGLDFVITHQIPKTRQAAACHPPTGSEFAISPGPWLCKPGRWLGRSRSVDTLWIPIVAWVLLHSANAVTQAHSDMKAAAADGSASPRVVVVISRSTSLQQHVQALGLHLATFATPLYVLVCWNYNVLMLSTTISSEFVLPNPFHVS